MTLDETIEQYKEKAKNLKNTVIKNIGFAMEKNAEPGGIGEIRLDEIDLEKLNEAFDYERIACWLMELKKYKEESLVGKKGKWEWNQRTGEYECSRCGCNPTYEGITPDVSEIDKYRYCRWCGAPMEVDG